MIRPSSLLDLRATRERAPGAGSTPDRSAA